jgi:MoaA/NifB/PqqE/SkfB family radical SAM enzyme
MYLKVLFKYIQRLFPKKIKNLIKKFYYTIKEEYFFSPTNLCIEITTRCNLRCKMCPQPFMETKDEDISFDNFRYIINQFPYLKRVDLTGFGENFLNRDFLKILQYAKEKKIYVNFIDNFTLISEEVSKELIRLKIDKIYASVDGAKKETFEKIRENAYFDKVIANIKTLCRLRKEYNSFIPEIAIIYTVSKDNINEMVSIVDIAISLGVDEIFYCPVRKIIDINNSDIKIDNLIPDFNIYMDNIKFVLEKTKYLNIKINYFNEREILKCREPWFNIRILHNGDLWPCCYGKFEIFGNIFRSSFRSIWMSKRYRMLRKEMLNGGMPDYCIGNPLCYVKKL